MKRLLLTGFGPFDIHSVNPTEGLVKELNQKVINDFEIVSKVLPVEYDSSINTLNNLIEEVNPDVIISLGLAGERTSITPELIAVNYQHCNRADNSGVIKEFVKIDSNAKESFFSTLPLKKMINNLKTESIPCELSSTAGTYVCNTVMYQGLRKVALDKRETLSGFIHIPPNLDQEILVNAITVCINSL